MENHLFNQIVMEIDEIWWNKSPTDPTWPKTEATVLLTESNIQSSASRKIDPELSAELGSEPLLEKRLLTCEAKDSYKDL